MHKHLFKNIGGGCFMGGGQFPCDDHYRCECTAEFKLKTSVEGHAYLPESFEVQEMTEIKRAEIEAIKNPEMLGIPNNNLNNLPPTPKDIK